MVGKSPGISPREHQDLARHSTYALTTRYTHSRFYDLAAAVQGLPIPMGRTDGKSISWPRPERTENGQKNLSLNLTPQLAILGDSERRTETIDMGASQTENPGKAAISATFPGFSENRKSKGDGTRTRNLRRDRPVL